MLCYFLLDIECYFLFLFCYFLFMINSFNGRCPEGIGPHNVKMSLCPSVFLSICHVTFSRPLIGQKSECYIVKEVIKVDELDKGNISAALGKQDK